MKHAAVLSAHRHPAPLPHPSASATTHPACSLTQDELGELLGRLAAAPKSDGGRHEGGTAGVPIGGGVTVTAGGAGGTGQGSGEERAEDARASG